MKLQGRTRQWAIYGLRLAFGLGILVACFTLLDVSALPEAFARLDAFWLFVSFALTVIGTIVIPAMITKSALAIDRVRMSLGEIIALNFSVRLYVLILPRGFSYGLRWLRYRRAGSGHDALARMTFEQLVQLFVMMASATVALLVERDRFPEQGPALLLLASAMTVALAIGLTPFLLPTTTGVLQRIVAFADRFSPGFISRRLHSFVDAVRAFHGMKAARHFGIVFLSFLSFLTLVITAFVVAMALGIDVTIAALAWIRPLVFLTTLLPFTIGGVGVREAAFIALLHLYGVSAHEALALSLILFANQVAVGLIGACIELRRYLVPADSKPADGLGKGKNDA